MPAKDYVFVEVVLGTIYLAKKTKTPNLMSQDRRIVTDDEIIGLFETYLRRKCRENDDNTLFIKDENGNEIFRAILKSEENGNPDN